MKKILLFTLLGVCLGTLILASCFQASSGAGGNKSGLASLEVGVPDEVKGKFSKIELKAISDSPANECIVETATLKANSNQDSLSLDVDLLTTCFPYTFTMIIWDTNGDQWYHGNTYRERAIAGEPLDVEIPLTKVAGRKGQTNIDASSVDSQTTTSSDSDSGSSPDNDPLSY